MFTNISWTTYIGFVALLLAVWYIIVGLRFYLKDLQALLSGKQPALTPSDAVSLTSEQSETVSIAAGEEESDNLFQQMGILTEKIKEAVSGAASKKHSKEEFCFLLQLTLKEYPALKGNPFQSSINNLIASECERNGFIRLSAEELQMLWVEV